MDHPRPNSHRHYRDDAADVDWDHVWTRQEARAALAPLWWKLAGGRMGARVVDVGCGPGYFALRYAAWVGPTGRVLAIDLVPAALRALEARRGPEHAALVTARVDIEREPLPEEGFDAAFVTNVLHHAPEPGAVLARLRPAARRIVIAEYEPEGAGAVGPDKADRLSAATLVAMLAHAGWRVEKTLAHPEDEMYTIVAA